MRVKSTALRCFLGNVISMATEIRLSKRAQYFGTYRMTPQTAPLVETKCVPTKDILDLMKGFAAVISSRIYGPCSLHSISLFLARVGPFFRAS